jgi:hypothetical protein
LIDSYHIHEEEKNNENNLFNLIKEKILSKYRQNAFNNLSSFCDSLVNLAVIYQFKNSTSISAFNMYYLSVMLEPSNNVANIDYNNFLRESNNKLLSDDFIRNRINYDSILDKIEGKFYEDNKNEFCFIESIQANPYINCVIESNLMKFFNKKIKEKFHSFV